MRKVGVIVDGQGDYNSLKARFVENCRILKTDGPRSHTTPIEAIVLGSRKQISMLRACGCNKVVILTDFEMRTDDYDHFVATLRSRLTAQYAGNRVTAAVPNRMIENWYLADIEQLSSQKSFIMNNLRQKNYEGSNGKDELKKCFTGKHSYSETIHGPQMFEILRFHIARRNSGSLHDFLLILEGN
ncbi:MAG: DUF4276 family protein [Dehalococcoidia bacterium]|jgi:hypothetical protein